MVRKRQAPALTDAAFSRLARALARARVRYLVIGVGGANLWAHSAGLIFATEDRDLFLPPDPRNALKAWRAAEQAALHLWCGDEPLGRPLDRILAERIVERRALVRAESPALRVDFALVMAGFTFEQVWRRRRSFRVGGVAVPVASLSDIVTSNARAGRPKDRLFLAMHEAALAEVLTRLAEPAQIDVTATLTAAGHCTTRNRAASPSPPVEHPLECRVSG